MTYEELIRHFGTQIAIAESIGMTQSAVANWKSRGRIPLHCQYQLERVTNRKLKMDEFPIPQSVNGTAEIDE